MSPSSASKVMDNADNMDNLGFIPITDGIMHGIQTKLLYAAENVPFAGRNIHLSP